MGLFCFVNVLIDFPKKCTCNAETKKNCIAICINHVLKLHWKKENYSGKYFANFMEPKKQKIGESNLHFYFLK